MYFYSRPYARGDSSFIPVPTFWLHFYSRPYARGDQPPLRSKGGGLLFLLTPLREGRPVLDLDRAAAVVISTHAPTRGATRSGARGVGKDADFYSRPYARGDRAHNLAGSRACISTRAPTRGATQAGRDRQAGAAAISTRAPTRGATEAHRRHAERKLHFYSRPYARGDRGRGRGGRYAIGISTRAPTRGATHEGESAAAAALTFLLAPLREGRRGAAALVRERYLYFYSRPYARGDQIPTVLS